ncbi:MAG TPA: M48 family metalloprotease [Alphaproteobacteria bacterium]|nr:M48 family metalloprotease [Alphaproteobacteria bacterium]
MKGHRLHMLVAAALALSGALVCPTPAAADWFPTLLSPAQEAKLGAEQNPQVIKEFGGVYNDPALANYVTSIGKLLASTSEEPNVNYTFTVLDSPIVNAFSLPGGYVYVTRGLMALANDEAELAGVMAHEIGHINAHHAAQRYSQSLIAQLGLGILGAVTKSNIASQVGGVAAQLVLRSYSREQEFESDTRGVRYMSRVGFDPHAMAQFLSTLQAHDQLQAQITGQSDGGDPFGLLATHPRTADRVERAIEQAGAVTVQNPVVARDIYLRKLEGVVYGDNPDQGLIRGRRFVHPKLRFAFEVPEGFRLINSADAVLALGAQDARIEFDFAARPPNMGMAGYLTSVWAKGVSLRGVETITVNGMEAATGSARLSTQQGTADIRPVAIAFDANTAARFVFVTPPAATDRLAEGFKATTYSFRRISAGEAEQVKPYRLHVIQAASGDTVESLAARQPFSDFSEERLRVLNGLGPGDALAPGALVKIVTAN